MPQPAPQRVPDANPEVLDAKLRQVGRMAGFAAALVPPIALAYYVLLFFLTS